MVVREDGTKWACQPCLKGHRVSGCTHTDRELTLVPKKGRPVTQCQHCRHERKKRSAHVKCDCAEPEKSHHTKEKCIHLREAEEKARAGGFFVEEHAEENDRAHLTAVAEEQGCCCHHGGKCTCSVLKKETCEDDGAPPHGKPAVHRPRLESTRSDGWLTVFANGHHKPCHRKNHAAHESGLPYKMSMQRSHTDTSRAAARRSIDSLALDRVVASSSSAVPPLPTGPYFNPARRLSKSEQASPKLRPLSISNDGLIDTKLSTIDLESFDQVCHDQSMESAASGPMAFPSFDPMSGLTDNTFDPWSALPSGDCNTMPNNNPFGVWPTSNDPNGIAQPALTAASSGTQSEIDDLPAMEEAYFLGMPSIQEDTSGFLFDGGMVTSSPQSNRRSLPPSFFGNLNFGTAGPGNDWLPGLEDFGPVANAKPKVAGLGVTVDGGWQTSASQPATSISHRTMGGISSAASSGRPLSHTIGPGSAPNDELMRQLFPDSDLDGGVFDSGSGGKASSAVPIKTSSSLNGISTSDNVSHFDNDVGFTSQPWADGSLSVPNDPTFSSPYDLEQEFSEQGFADWTR